MASLSSNPEIQEIVSIMELPFSPDEFLEVFGEYNLSVWPAQIVLFSVALITLLCIYRKVEDCSKGAFLVLSFLWAWMGIVYHIIYFSSINKAAYIFGALFIVQSIIFFYLAIVQDKVRLRIRGDAQSIFGLVFIVYALIIYPAIGFALGRAYPNAPTFGVPCPTTIFTFGLLLFALDRVPFFVLVIPILWSLVGVSAAFSLGVMEDIGLFVTAVVSTVFLMFHNSIAKKKST